MHRFRDLMFLFCLVLLLQLVSSVSAAEMTPAPMGTVDYTLSSTPLEISRGNLSCTSISLSAPDVVVEELVVDNETYQYFGMPGEPFVMEEGNPAIPQIARFYRIPNTGGVDLVITNAEFELREGVNILPYKFDDTESFDAVRRSAAYADGGWYPPAVAEISEPMLLRDFRVVRVVLYPVQVNAVTGQARVYQNLSVDIVANDQLSVNELTHPRPVTRSWVPIYQSMISNLDEDALLQVTETPGAYLIFARNNAQMWPWVDSLATWKKRKGFDVIIDTTHSSSVSQMINTVQTTYAAGDPPLEFVALMGDPSGNFGVPTDNSEFEHGFALGNNGDDLEDIGVGRLSGTSGAEMATINAKIMGYERNPHMETAGGDPDTMWFHRGYFLAGLNWNIGSNITMQQWSAQQFRNWTGVDCTYVRSYYGDVPSQQVCDYLNLGISICFLRGAWQYEWDGPSGCQPSWRLPIGYFITCNSNDYAFGQGVAESMLTAGTASAPKACVASIGTSTAGTHANFNVTVAGGISYNVANLNVEHYGHVLNGAKLWLHLLWGPGGWAADFMRWNNLMGDPGLSIWTDVPNVMDVEHASTLNVGAHHFGITLTDADNGSPIDEALVCLWKGEETFARALTDASGHADLPISIVTPGNLLVTVTKRNHKPYLATVPCVAAAQMVALSSYSIDDDNSGGTTGNDDGVLNPGETIDLPLYLRNFGNATTATNVSATLASDNTRVSVVSAASSFANIAPGDSALSATPFRIQIAPDMQNEDDVQLTWNVTASAVQTTSATEIECLAPDAGYSAHVFTGAVNPGTTNNLRVTILNTGEYVLDDAIGTLQSLSPFVQVDDAGGTFADINPGGQGTNTADQFTLTSNSLTFRGHQAPMRLFLATPGGFVDTVQFTVSIGNALSTDPTGPDAYGYYAYDNTDATYEMAPTFEYVNISGGLGEDLNLNDPGDPGAPNPIVVYSRVRELPFDFTFYGQTYDTVTICSNGWIAFGNQGYLDFFRNYPMPAMQAPDAMIAPYWDDLKTDGADGVWHYFDEANHRYIVQWKAHVYTGGGAAQDFEVILYDEFFYPTFDGNGQVLVQYNDVTMGVQGDSEEPNGCTIGIQAPRGLVALQYAHIATYMPGSATISDGRAILYTTDARMLFGAITGTVLDAETNLPMPGVDVTIDGYSYHTITDAAGHYLLDDVLIGTYTVRVHKRAYNDATTANIVVELDSTETVNFSMLHPEFETSTDEIHLIEPETQTTFDIVNGGNGPLDYAMTISYAGDESPDPWDLLAEIDLTEQTDDQQMMGCEFVGDYWWVSGGGGEGGNNFFYRFDLAGNYVDAIPQPSTSAFGWLDLAYDGNFVYGSDSPVITGVDETGTPQTTIPSPLHPTRAIAYDPASDHFWVADMVTDIYEIARDGTIIQQIPNGGNLRITGLAWNESDEEGYNLYIFSTGQDISMGADFLRMHPVSHDVELVTSLAVQEDDHAAGFALTPNWNSTLVVLGGVLQNPAGDRLGIYEVDFNTSWIDVSPLVATVPGGNLQEVAVTIDPSSLRPNGYHINLNIASTVLDTTYIIPVFYEVLSVPDDNRGSLPTEYALYQNYPNPFNPSTEIRFDLPQGANVELRIYNTLGQRVRTLLNEAKAAGTHVVTWDGLSDYSEGVSTGLYIYEIRAGAFAQSKKMIFLR